MVLLKHASLTYWNLADSMLSYKLIVHESIPHTVIVGIRRTYADERSCEEESLVEIQHWNLILIPKEIVWEIPVFDFADINIRLRNVSHTIFKNRRFLLNSFFRYAFKATKSIHRNLSIFYDADIFSHLLICKIVTGFAFRLTELVGRSAT